MPIVCGSDLSEGSAEATLAAVAFAALRGEREIVLVHVLPEDDVRNDGERDRLAAAARATLDAAAARATEGFDVTVRTLIVAGAVVDALLSAADTEGADVVVVAAQHEPPGSAPRLGAIADAVVAASAVPVLLVRAAAPLVAWARRERPLKVLLGVDDTSTCDAAINTLKRLRERSPIDVTLGTVYYADEAARHFGLHVESAVDANPEVERLLSRDLMRRFGAPIGEGTVTARPIRGLGRVGDHVIELAEAEAVDLIVLGTHQKTGLGRLGSVSSVVAHLARQSVMCVPPGTAGARADVPSIATAVVATDLSAFANRAVPYAYALVGAAGEVHIVHVREEVPDDRAALERQLAALAPPGLGGRTRTHVLVGEDPAELVAETAARVGADVICIASHGRSGLSRALVGSVADRLLRETRLPVLVLRPKA
jgi:nucleotide-binding universal stress UspA family protein